MENDLKFTGESPVIIDYNGSADDLYAPVVTTSYDVNLVSDRILDDLYTAEKDDIAIKITKYIPTYRDEIFMKNRGRVETDYLGDVDPRDNFSIAFKQSMFVDDKGDYIFHGQLRDYLGLTLNANLKYNHTTNTWDFLTGDENLKYGDFSNPDNGPLWQYFTDGEKLFKVCLNANQWHESFYWVWTPEINDWYAPPSSSSRGYLLVCYKTPAEDYSYNVEIKCDKIIRFDDGDLELVNRKERYVWKRKSTGYEEWQYYWGYKPSYVLTSGEDYESANGARYLKAKDTYGNLTDAIVVTGIGGKAWICSMNKTAGTLTKMVELDSPDDADNIFSDDDGNIYCIKSSGELYCWSWEHNIWFKWITFRDRDITPGTMGLSYIIPQGDYTKKKICIRYESALFRGREKTYNSVTLRNLLPPEIGYTSVIENYTEDKWRGGYVTPNMYSQEISLNLDQVNISCIDYVSIMKYVTVDNIFPEIETLPYGIIIGAIIAYVTKMESKIIVEDCVSYGGVYDGTNGILNLRCNLADFWDESGKASTAYEVIEEMLRPFCMRLCYHIENEFYIYNVNNVTEDTRQFHGVIVNEDGSIMTDGHHYSMSVRAITPYKIVSNNVSTPTIEIKSTYDKVSAVASTSVPTYSKMAIDLVDYNDREMYSVGDLNVQRNKTKGYQKTTRMVQPRPGQLRPVTVIEPFREDKWFYIWNGTYGNPDYNLGPVGTGDYIDWHMNINKAYEYLTGNTGNPSGTGSILNFYGGANNPTATGKSQEEEKGVEISKKITAYAADNGIPPEFLEQSDLIWIYNADGIGGGILHKTSTDIADAKWGADMPYGSSNRIVYHQEYDNIVLSTVQDTIVEINLSKTFSRTGVDIPIDILHNNTADQKQWTGGGNLSFASSYYFPAIWDARNIKVDGTYFKKYATDGEGSSCQPVWDEIRVGVYVKLSDGSWLQFSGKDWVRDRGDHNIPFYLGRMMTYQNLYHTDFRYNCIRSSVDTNSFIDSQKYSLTDDEYVFYLDRDGGVSEKETNNYTKCPPVKDQGFGAISGSSEGSISIKLPYVDDPGATVYVDIYNSSMLGMTGRDTSEHTHLSETETFYYTTENAQTETTQDFREVPVRITLIPVNATHVKAEHLDLKISITVPESNLGQMFQQSDIKYVINSGKNYVDEFVMPEFKVNTRNNFVLSSQSYLLFNDKYADPGDFIINGLSGRPENYTVQAYFNWLTRVRRILTKTVAPIWNNARHRLEVSDDFLNDRLMLLRPPESPDKNYLIVSNSWDVKSERHTYTAVESDDLYVDYVSPIQAEEIPRKARAERYNYPSAESRRGGVRK